MTRHIDSERLQDFREGLLSRREEARVRSHLETCSRCRAELETLAHLLDGLAGLPLEASPSRDLWPHIAWRIGAESGRADEAHPSIRSSDSGIGALRSAKTFGPRIAVPVWKLLAAGIVVALVSGGSVWAFLSADWRRPGSEVATLPETAQLAGLDAAYDGYNNAMADLELVLEHGREVLDPETVRVLEENLKTIDDAIAEARAAFDRDPASPVLQRILAENLRRKLGFLRQAVSAVYANT
jgi:hypothetical protein